MMKTEKLTLTREWDKTYPRDSRTEHRKLNPGLWVAHSRNVAECAEAIACHCNMNPDKAYVLGLLHDVGRRAGIGQLRHVYCGWKHMNELGYRN